MTAGGHDEGDGSGVDDWMRSGLNVDPPRQATEDPPRGGLFRRRTVFLGAGVLAAGFLGASVVISTIREGVDPPIGSTTSPASTSTPAPTTHESTTASSSPSSFPGGLENLESLDDLAAADPVLTDLVADCRAGSADACGGVLDLLAQDCQAGDFPACDGLYWVSPVGSDYETYGATCGGRFDPETAGRCAEQ